MVSFNDLLANQTVTPGGPTCLTGSWRGTLSENDRAQFDAACADRMIASSVIFRTIKAMGYPGVDSAFLRHRNGGCRCELR